MSLFEALKDSSPSLAEAATECIHTSKTLTDVGIGKLEVCVHSELVLEQQIRFSLTIFLLLNVTRRRYVVHWKDTAREFQISK